MASTSSLIVRQQSVADHFIELKEASTTCTAKDFTGQFPHTDKSESHFYVPKKVCQACEHHNNGYCTPMIEQDKKRLDESLERITAKNQEVTKRMFS